MDLRVATYNIRHGRGLDDNVDIGRIAAALATVQADIICLQEVDHSLPRSGFAHQAEHIAASLNCHFYFHANFGILSAGMGNAIISRFPLYSTWNITLPFLGEPRGLLHAATKINQIEFEIFCTHWGLTPGQRKDQSRAAAAKLASAGSYTLLCGDLNAVRSAVEIDALLGSTSLQDAGPVDGHTFPSSCPVVKIDYILATPQLTSTGSRIISSDASDHNLLVTDFETAEISVQ